MPPPLRPWQRTEMARPRLRPNTIADTNIDDIDDINDKNIFVTHFVNDSVNDFVNEIVSEIVNKFKFSTGEIGRSGKIVKQFEFLTGEIINKFKFKFLTGEIVKKFKFLTREIGNKFKFSKNIKERFRQTDEPPPNIVKPGGGGAP